MQHQVFNEALLLQQLSQGSREAFAALFFHYKDRIYHITGLYTKDNLVAEEIVQEVFLIIWRKKEKAASINDFKSWLFIVTRNHVINYLEKWAHQKSLEHNWAKDNTTNETVGQQYADSTQPSVSYEQYASLLADAINLLPAQQQAVFKLAKEQSLSYQSIAEKLEISPLTVKTHMQRAFQFIRKYFAQQGGTGYMLFLSLLAELTIQV